MQAPGRRSREDSHPGTPERGRHPDVYLHTRTLRSFTDVKYDVKLSRESNCLIEGVPSDHAKGAATERAEALAVQRASKEKQLAASNRGTDQRATFTAI